MRQLDEIKDLINAPAKYVDTDGDSNIGTLVFKDSGDKNTSSILIEGPNAPTNGTLDSFRGIDIHHNRAGKVRIGAIRGSEYDSYLTVLTSQKSSPSVSETLKVGYDTFNYKGNKIWHAGNDGTDSGLDADLLDGLHANKFLREVPCPSHRDCNQFLERNAFFAIDSGAGAIYNTPQGTIAQQPGFVALITNRFVVDFNNGNLKRLQQEYTNLYPTSNTTKYIRNYDGNTWGSWVKIYTSSDKPTLDELNAVAKTGDIMSGNLTIQNGGTPQLIAKNTGTGDAALVLERNNVASWRLRNSSGSLHFETNYLQSTGKGDYFDAAKIEFDNSNLIVRGDIFAKNGQKVYHSGNKPTWNDILNKPDSFNVVSHNHTSLTDITSLSFRTASSDSAMIKTVIDGTNTYMDFFLSDDENQEKWRWRFDSCNGNEFSAMELRPTSANSADLRVAGNIYNNGHQVWHQGNQGHSSGLNADMIDGIDGANIVYGSNIAAVNNADNLDALWKSGFYDANGGQNTPTTNDWHWVLNIAHRNNNTNYRYGMQLAAAIGSVDLWYRSRNVNGAGTWYKMWNSGNHGTGSGLDADKLDGFHADKAAVRETIVVRDTTGAINVSNVKTDAFTLNNQVTIRYNNDNKAIEFVVV